MVRNALAPTILLKVFFQLLRLELVSSYKMSPCSIFSDLEDSMSFVLGIFFFLMLGYILLSILCERNAGAVLLAIEQFPKSRAKTCLAGEISPIHRC